MWGKCRNGRYHSLSLALGWNKRGRFLVMSEMWGKRHRRNFIPEGIEVGGWWRIMKSIFELAEVPIVNPFKDSLC